VRHLDGDPANNQLENLAYGSAKENAADCIAHGRRHRGHKHPMARLTEEQVRIIKDPARGLSVRTLALLFGVTESHVCNIQAGLTWKHVCAA
jgi:DNA-binding NarL/FixJ family response regulator